MQVLMSCNPVFGKEDRWFIEFILVLKDSVEDSFFVRCMLLIHRKQFGVFC